ncbi:MAG: hypothetical protein BME93_06540 [Methanosarcinales archaeon Met12]|nr:MAG: hypothetical protein BME93_06540 [Methanosarcinales archaeon Met12]
MSIDAKSKILWILIVCLMLLLSSGTAGWLSRISLSIDKPEYPVGETVGVTIQNTGLWYIHGIPSITVYRNDGSKVYEHIPFEFSGAFPLQDMGTFYWTPREPGEYRLVGRIYVAWNGAEISAGLGGWNRLESKTSIVVV